MIVVIISWNHQNIGEWITDSLSTDVTGPPSQILWAGRRTCRWSTRPSTVWRSAGTRRWATSAATRSSTHLNQEEKNEWWERNVWAQHCWPQPCGLSPWLDQVVVVLTEVVPFCWAGGGVRRHHHHHAEEPGCRHRLQCGCCSCVPRRGGHSAGQEGKDKWVTHRPDSSPQNESNSKQRTHSWKHVCIVSESQMCKADKVICTLFVSV